jgi:hypothetical protein
MSKLPKYYNTSKLRNIKFGLRLVSEFMKIISNKSHSSRLSNGTNSTPNSFLIFLNCFSQNYAIFTNSCTADFNMRSSLCSPTHPGLSSVQWGHHGLLDFIVTNQTNTLPSLVDTKARILCKDSL